MSTRIAINGANGRMGRALIKACIENPHAQLAAAMVRAGSPHKGQDAGTLAGIAATDIALVDDRNCLPDNLQVWIDFTLPEGMIDALHYCLSNKIPMVIGTTGLNDSQKQEIQRAGKQIPIVFAPNMSIGVNLCFSILKTAAETLGDEYDVEIIEAHHKNKVDAPSGTALRMGEVVADALGVDLKDKAQYTRHGNIGAREAGTIGFQTVRAGDIVGEHTVIFGGIGERVEITHKASSRLTFARGAVRAANWLVEKQNGVFDMQDVLGLSLK